MRRPVRIVHVIPALESGGAEQQLLALTRSQDRDLWEPHVICVNYLGPLGPDFEAAGVPVEVVGKRHRYDLSIVPRLVRAIARHEPDIVHTWLFSGNFWGRIAAQLLPRRPVIIASERNVEIWKHTGHHAIDRILSRGTDMIVGNASQVSEFIVRVQHIPPEKVATIRNGFVFDRVQRCLRWTEQERAAYRAKLGLPADAFVIGHIARPSWEKRFDLLVDVVAELRRRGVPVRLLQLGRDPLPTEEAYFAEYQLRIDERGVRDLILRRGFVREVSPELAVMDTLVQTSDVEGFPNAVLEAMAMEVPVVATAAGGTPDLVIHRTTGWLVPTGDLHGLVEGLTYVWQHPDEARRWGRAARRHVEAHFSVEALVRNMTALYAQLLRRYGRPMPGGA